MKMTSKDLTFLSLQDFLNTYRDEIHEYWDLEDWGNPETVESLSIFCIVDTEGEGRGTMGKEMYAKYRRCGKERRERMKYKYFYENPFNRIHGFIILEDFTGKKNVPEGREPLSVSYICSSSFSHISGIGSSLMEFAKKYAKEMNSTDIILEVANDIATECEDSEEESEEGEDSEEESEEDDSDEEADLEDIIDVITHEFWRKTMRHRYNENGKYPFYNVDEKYIRINIETYFGLYEEDEEEGEGSPISGSDDPADNEYGGFWYKKGKNSMIGLQRFYEKFGFVEDHRVNTEWKCFCEIPFPSMILHVK